MSSSYPFVRAIRGPIILIVLGALFALDQFDHIGFERTWPVLIILIGLMKLLERLLAGSYIPPTPVGGGPAR